MLAFLDQFPIVALRQQHCPLCQKNSSANSESKQEKRFHANSFLIAIFSLGILTDLFNIREKEILPIHYENNPPIFSI